MVKGCVRRVIHLSSTDSRLFDEAYFIMNEGADTPPPTEKDMVKEANRILVEALSAEERRARARRRRAVRDLVFVLVGAVTATLFCVLLL